MKTLVASIVTIILVASCGPDDRPGKPHVATEDEKAAAFRDASHVVERFGRMWEDEDMATFDEIIARDADLVVIGTDAAERIVGFDAYRDARVRQFVAFENVEYDVRNLMIKISDDARAAWFTQEFNLFLLTAGEPLSLEGLRLSGGLEKRGDRWVIVQLHTSVPVAGQAAEY